MSDLSRLLDDVYGDAGTSAGVAPDGGDGTAALPEWALESVLDDAFADWLPGEGAPAAPERATGSRFEAAPPAAVEVRWSRGDDDILPSARRGRRSAAPAPAAPVAASAEPTEPSKRRFALRRG